MSASVQDTDKFFDARCPRGSQITQILSDSQSPKACETMLYDNFKEASTPRSRRSYVQRQTTNRRLISALPDSKSGYKGVKSTSNTVDHTATVGQYVFNQTAKADVVFKRNKAFFPIERIIR